MIVTIINIYSVKLSRNIQIIFTVAKLSAIAAIIIGGVVKMAQGNTQYLENGFQGTKTSFSSIALAFYGGMFSYGGWLVIHKSNPGRAFMSEDFNESALLLFGWMLIWAHLTEISIQLGTGQYCLIAIWTYDYQGNEPNLNIFEHFTPPPWPG